MSDAMNAPVTRAELREELATEVAKLATKAELQEEVAKLATKAELREEVAKLATKAELHSALEIWAGALREELKADAQQREERMTATITATTTATITATITAATASMTATITANIAEHVSTELARHVGAFKEHTQTQISVIDDKYQDVPPRLANVEALAHTHPEPPSKKATGRRSR